VRDSIADCVFRAENVSVVPADEDIVREDRGFEVSDFRFTVGCGFILFGGDHVDVRDHVVRIGRVHDHVCRPIGAHRQRGRY